jgi:hypothetical protein
LVIDQNFKSFFPIFQTIPKLFFGAWRCAESRRRRQSLQELRLGQELFAVAARAAYLARTQRNVPDEAVAASPESPAIQGASLVNLSVPTSQLTSRLAVMSLHPAPSPVLPASAEIPASAELPVSTEIPASAAIPRTIAPSTQYVRVGEKAPKLSAVPTRQQVHEITQLLLSTDSPFSPVDVVHHNNYELMETLLMKKFATDPPRREECKNWMSWTNQRF